MTDQETKQAANRLYLIAKNVMGRICKADSISTTEEKFLIEGNAEAMPFTAHLKVTVYPENGIMTIFSVLPFDVPVEKALEYSKLICLINYNDFYTGSFDYHPDRGKVVFRVAIPYSNSLISETLVEECLNYTINTVSKYSERLFEATR